MYKVIISNVAKKQMDRINYDVVKRISTKALSLEKEPRPPGCVKLKAKYGYRIRIGNYRILYEIDDLKNIVTIYKIAHRKEVYR